MIRIKVVSDGTIHGTNVVNADTGEPITGVTNLSLSASVEDGTVSAVITFIKVPVDVICKALEK